MASPARSHPLRVNEITGAIVNSAMKVHSLLGPGLLESAYQTCLAHELRNRGFEVATEVPMPVVYEGHKLEVGYRIDLIVERRVVVEVKSVEVLHPIHHAQLLSYMRLSRIPIGLLINFNVLHLRDGIKRMVDGKDWENYPPVFLCAPCGERFFGGVPRAVSAVRGTRSCVKQIWYLTESTYNEILPPCPNPPNSASQPCGDSTVSTPDRSVSSTKACSTAPSP